MSETVKGGIEQGASTEEVHQDIDPELHDDREADEVEGDVVDLPDYDPTQFEFDDEEGDE